MLEIQSSKIVLTLVDTETGELFTKEATFGEFVEAKKASTTSRTKKPKDTDPVPKLIVLDGKVQLNNKAVELTGFEPEMKIAIEFEKKGRQITPILFEDDNKGNRLTKTYTISCRGSKHDNLIEYGTVFELIPYEGKPNFFKLKGDAPEKEDDIIDLPKEIAEPDEIEDDIEEPTSLDDFDLDL